MKVSTPSSAPPPRSQLKYDINFYLPGSLTDPELALLQSLSKACDGDILEIGGFQGRSAIAMAETLNANHKIYTIDSWPGNRVHGSRAWVDGGVYNDKRVFLDNIDLAGFSKKIKTGKKNRKHLRNSNFSD